ncbi:terminase large subunit [Roseomonas sp. USHLN139]|uniref:terminase large subunit n=1 Tax=Roseomonas sp. USHLN139 TaxID=3081298 RepID=UPI003B023CC3
MTAEKPARKPRASRAKAPTTTLAGAPDHPVTLYARAVTTGELPAGPLVRGECARHLRDLADGHKRGLFFDREKADRALAFFPKVLRLNGGEHEGAPFELLPWQVFVVGSLFGWVNLATGYRRFRMAFVLTGKGSGKSPLAAGVGIYCLTSDGEPRAEVYAAAFKKDQAQILFRDAVAMVDQSPALSARLQKSGGDGKEWNLAYLKTGSFFRTIASGDGQSGPRPHCALLDEIHEHRDNTTVEMLRAGTKGRRQALMFAITNAEADRTSVCAQYREYAGKVARGDLMDDAFFSYVAGLDEDDDPFKDESCWAKANPSLGHTFGMQYLREQVTQARGMPSKEAIVRRLNFCQPTDAAAPWIDRDAYEACEADFKPDELIGLPCWLGLDLSSKRDLTALAAVWLHPDGRRSVATWSWTPGDTMDERARTDNVPYRAWKDAEWLFAPAGRLIDKGHVARFVQQLAARHDLKALAYDNAQMDDFLRACDDIGFDAWIDDGEVEAHQQIGLRLVRHGQGYSGFNSETVLWMPRSISQLEEAIIKGQLAIQRNPVLRWANASAVVAADPSGNRRFDKRKATGRIDPLLAVTMAMGASHTGAPVAPVSVFDREDVYAALFD